LTRGELYRVSRPGGGDPKRFRVFVIVSRQVLIDSTYSTMLCAPVYSNYSGISTQVPVGIEEGLKHESAIHCDSLMSVQRGLLTHYVGKLSRAKSEALNQALRFALDL
jgi:mRNA interferase MazF